MNAHQKFLIPGLFLILFLSIIGCDDPQIQYVGKEIKIDFQNVRDIQDLDWIEIDGIRYVHYVDQDNQTQDSVSIPASKTAYPGEDVNRFEPVNPFTIAILLGSYVEANSFKNDYSTATIVEDQKYLVYTHGTLILHHKEGKDITVITEADYPANIEVIK